MIKRMLIMLILVGVVLGGVFGFKFFVDYASDYITVMPTISAYFSPDCASQSTPPTKLSPETAILSSAMKIRRVRFHRRGAETTACILLHSMSIESLLR